MRLKLISGAVALGLLGMSNGILLSAQDNPPKADNTKVNQRDRSKGASTADQAKNNPNDREIMQKIRQSVVGDKTLSTYAHNVKIITQGGQVTLKGPVQDDNEKQTIASKAAEVVGTDKVNNQLTVKQ